MNNEVAPSFLRDRPHLNVGTLGHTGHGKTTLSAALTQVLAKKYGSASPWAPRPLSVIDICRGGLRRALDGGMITVRANELEYESSRRHYSHLDCPGRRNYLKNTAVSASLLDAIVLVVAADESVMAQTREHALLARQAGVSRVVVFLNKCDRVTDGDLLDIAEEEARQMLADCGFSGDEVPVIRGAALPAYEGDPHWESSLHALLDVLDQEVSIPVRELDGPVLLPVHHTHPHAQGTILVGRLERGTLRRGQELEVVGLGDEPLSGRALDMEIFRRKVEEGQAGDYISVLFAKNKDRGPFRVLRRGHVLAAPGSVKPRREFSCDVYMLKTEEGGRHTPFFDGHISHFFLKTASVTGVFRLTKAVGVWPGRRASLNVTLDRPVFLEKGMTFSFRDGCDGFQRLHGGGPTWGGTAGVGVITQVEE